MRRDTRELVKEMLLTGCVTQEDVLILLEIETKDVYFGGADVKNGEFDTGDGIVFWELNMAEDVYEVEASVPGPQSAEPDMEDVPAIIGDVVGKVDDELLDYLKDTYAEKQDWRDGLWDWEQDMVDMVEQEFENRNHSDHETEVEWEGITDWNEFAFTVTVYEK